MKNVLAWFINTFKMIEDKEIEKNLKDLDDICDECKEQHESVTQNLILTGFKICKSCRVSKTIFPIQIIKIVFLFY